MVISSPPASSLCAGSSSAWSKFSTDTNDSQWLPDITSNFLLALAFSFSYFVEEPWIWIRLALILGHGIAASLSLSRCQIKAFMWAVLLIAVNCYRLVKIGISHWPTRMPKYLQEVYLTTFKAYCVSSPDFVTIVEKYRLQGIGPEEDLYSEGNLRHDHVDLCILVSGKMTVWCDGLPIHGIYPGQFINSVEWASVLKLQDTLDDMGWEQQVQICSDEDSTYLRIHGDHLEWLKSHKNKLWRLLEAIVCADVSEKLYKMNEGFEKIVQQRDQVKKKALIRLSVRSVSLEALHVSSKGWNVSDNWLQAENRSKLLDCPHGSDGMPAAHEIFMNKRRNSIGATQMQRVSNASVAYLLRNSHSELLRDAEENGNVIPSLRMQALRINPLSCRFRDETIIRHYEPWDNSWNHCGECQVCKPLIEEDPTLIDENAPSKVK